MSSPPLLGLDLGATTTKAVLCDPAGAVLAEAKWGSVPHTGAVESHLLHQVQQFCPAPPAAIGVAICGLISPDGATMLHAPNAPALQEVPYRDTLQGAFEVPTILLNDAKAFMYAEARIGAAQGMRHAIGLTLGTGIGGGLLLNGELYLGTHGWLGEIGHIPLDPNGPLCKCGLVGCLEAFCGKDALLTYYNTELTDPRQRLEKASALVDRAQAGDPLAIDTWQRYGFYLGEALHSAVTLLDLECIVLGGGLASAANYFQPALEAVLDHRLSRRSERGVQIRLAQGGRHAGAIGAALYALHQSRPPF